MQKLPLYIADMKAGDRMVSLSFVRNPASGLRAKILSHDDNGCTVFAPILPANVPIYRNNNVYGKHYVMFLPDVISEMIDDTKKRSITFDTEHSGRILKGVRLLESYQIDYQSGKTEKRYFGLPDGSWVGVFYIPNMVLSSFPKKSTPLQLFGISISGIFSYEEVTLKDAIEFYKSLKI